MSVILGINTNHAGSSAAIIVGGVPVAAIAEERLNRIKYYAGFPKLSILKCLEIADTRKSSNSKKISAIRRFFSSARFTFLVPAN